MFKLACNFLEEVTVQKITILDKNNKEQLFENIREDNIEEKFGGTAPNVQGSIEINKSAISLDLFLIQSWYSLKDLCKSSKYSIGNPTKNSVIHSSYSIVDSVSSKTISKKPFF